MNGASRVCVLVLGLLLGHPVHEASLFHACDPKRKFSHMRRFCDFRNPQIQGQIAVLERSSILITIATELIKVCMVMFLGCTTDACWGSKNPATVFGYDQLFNLT